jgi:DNA modification methylase
MGEVSPQNRLNELSAQEWLRFTKTWFVHNPPRRKKNEVLHPAKYPEDMIEGFIRFFTKEGQVVFDPFLGTGSTLVAAFNSGRKGVGIELQEKYAHIAKERITALQEQQTLNENTTYTQQIIGGNSADIEKLWKKHDLPELDLVMTSPPYGPMLNKKGLASKGREEKGLDTKYSDDSADIGNAENYEDFLVKLVDIFKNIKPKLKTGGHLVVVLQNYMHKGEYKMLAWDFAREMTKHFQLRGERIWCQDNKTLYPYGYRYSFVPNVHHHYCLVFKKV